MELIDEIKKWAKRTFVRKADLAYELRDQDAHVGGLVLSSGSATLSGGVVTLPSGVGWLLIDTEAAAATDDLDIISGGSLGQLLLISAANSNRTVVAKDVAAGGNLNLSADMTLNNQSDTLLLVSTGSTWRELARSDNGI